MLLAATVQASTRRTHTQIQYTLPTHLASYAVAQNCSSILAARVATVCVVSRTFAQEMMPQLLARTKPLHLILNVGAQTSKNHDHSFAPII